MFFIYRDVFENICLHQKILEGFLKIVSYVIQSADCHEMCYQYFCIIYDTILINWIILYK